MNVDNDDFLFFFGLFVCSMLLTDAVHIAYEKLLGKRYENVDVNLIFDLNAATAATN